MSNTKTPRPSLKRRTAPTKRALVGKKSIRKSVFASRKMRQIKRRSND